MSRRDLREIDDEITGIRDIRSMRASGVPAEEAAARAILKQGRKESAASRRALAMWAIPIVISLLTGAGGLIWYFGRSEQKSIQISDDLRDVAARQGDTTRAIETQNYRLGDLAERVGKVEVQVQAVEKQLDREDRRPRR